MMGSKLQAAVYMLLFLLLKTPSYRVETNPSSYDHENLENVSISQKMSGKASYELRHSTYGQFNPDFLGDEFHPTDVLCEVNSGLVDRTGCFRYSQDRFHPSH
jgi:hypothetical protein